MAIVSNTPTEEQRRRQELTNIVGKDKAITADRSMYRMKWWNRGLLSAVGLLVGGVIGHYKKSADNPNAMPLGAGIGAAAGLGTALLGETLGEWFAGSNTEVPSKKEIKEKVLEPGATGYLIPGYADYYRQRVEDMGYNKDLAALEKARQKKSAAVLTEKEVEKMIEEAEEKKLQGREILKKYTPKQIVALANGIGPNWEPEWIARGLNWMMPWAKLPSVIHDLEWAEGAGNKREFDRSNTRYLNNNLKMRGTDSLVSAKSIVPEMLYVAVQSNRPHYRKGKEDNPYYKQQTKA